MLTLIPDAMVPEEFVEALYRNLLGRTTDASGLASWTGLMRTTGDPTRVLRGILDSQEYAARLASLSSPDCTVEIDRALSLLHRSLRVVDVGAQTLGIGSHPYDALLKLCEPVVIGFDPLTERLRHRAETEATPGLTLIPYAIGDGKSYTFYVNNDDATSSLFPLNRCHNACFNNLNEIRTVRTEPVKTHRLDDVLSEGPVDFLKIDVQGAELMVLEGADRTLSNTATVHCEVMFSPIYAEEPLFPAVHQHLMSRGFALIDILIPGRYHYLTPSGRMTQDRLIWADAVFFRETDDSETLRVQALVAASVYRKPTLAEHLLVRAEQAGGSKSEWGRVEMTVSCRDSDPIPKVPGAGDVFLDADGVLCQRMHNGLRVLAGAYHGEWMSEVIRRLRGHHEPQEELLFHTALPWMAPNESEPIMVELGSFWGYYSLWFRSVYPGGRNILVEPDPNNMRIGARNFELNGFRAEFLEAAIGVHNGCTEFSCESDGMVRPVRTVSVDGVVREFSLKQVNLLHADIQGAEVEMLNGAVETIERGQLKWVFLSTHHRSISGDPLTHQYCLDWLRAHGAFIVDEHSVSESFSGDGLIVAAFGQELRPKHTPISRNIPSRSLFPS